MKNTPTPSPVSGFRLRRLSFVAACALAALPAAAFAQTTTTWSGGGGDNNWGTGANWGGTPPPVGSSSDLVFAGTTRTNPFNNYTAFDNFRNIFFASGAGNFSITGIAIFAFFRAHPELLDPLSQDDQIVPLFVTQAMPLAFPGIVIAAIFAAAMSTVASSMNSVATIFTEDFYTKMRPQASDRERLLTLKIGSYVVGVIGTVMALLLAAQDLKSMMVVWNQLVALVGGGIVGVYSLGMFSTRANGFGAICGAIASIVITALVRIYTPLHWGTYIPIAIFSCIIVGYLASLLRPQGKDLKGLTVFTPAATSA